MMSTPTLLCAVLAVATVMEVNGGSSSGGQAGCESVHAVPTRTAVPFYFYPPEQFEMFRACKQALTTFPGSVKHAHVVFALNQLAHHPWRTTDPARAVLFFLPLPLDYMASQQAMLGAFGQE